MTVMWHNGDNGHIQNMCHTMWNWIAREQFKPVDSLGFMAYQPL